MPAPVFVDLGPDAGARERQIVLGACNAAIAGGVCRAGSGAEGPARAFAVVRAADASRLLLRIEVRATWAEEGAWLVRELTFSPRDPLRERWRSVGLAIATLVGESEERAREEAAQEQPEPPAAATAAAPPPAAVPDAPAPAEPEPPPPAATAERALAPELESPAGEATASDELTLERAVPDPPRDEPPAPEPRDGDDDARRPLFVGIGAIAGTGFGGGPGRLGAGASASWDTPSGLWFAASFGYAWRISEETFTVEWLSLDAGAGYRIQAGSGVSLGALVFGGAERARFEVLARGVSRSEARWSPRVGLRADVRWQLAPALGLWAGAQAAGSGRQDRLLVAPGREPIRALPIDVAAFMGIGWFLP